MIVRIVKPTPLINRVAQPGEILNTEVFAEKLIRMGHAVEQFNAEQGKKTEKAENETKPEKENETETGDLTETETAPAETQAEKATEAVKRTGRKKTTKE